MGGANGSRECAPDDKLRDTHQLHFMKMMGFAGAQPILRLWRTSRNIVARMERSEIRDSRDTGPGLRFAPSGLQRRDLPDGLNPRIDRPPSQKFSSNRPCTWKSIFSMGSTNLPDGQITQKSVKPLWQKYSDFPKLQISLYPPHPVPLRGAFRERHGRRGGMRWTQRCARRAILLRTVKSCGPGTSTLVSSLR